MWKAEELTHLIRQGQVRPTIVKDTHHHFADQEKSPSQVRKKILAKI